jgi:hypothetical protein
LSHWCDFLLATWRPAGDLATCWRPAVARRHTPRLATFAGNLLATHWRPLATAGNLATWRPGDLATCWRPAGDFCWRPGDPGLNPSRLGPLYIGEGKNFFLHDRKFSHRKFVFRYEIFWKDFPALRAALNYTYFCKTSPPSLSCARTGQHSRDNRHLSHAHKEALGTPATRSYFAGYCAHTALSRLANSPFQMQITVRLLSGPLRLI